ncbi:MAG: serine--tRNA ligase [Clostridiales bacterium]|nr:serine--tRNA ligase [Clostridiales bacterium]
MLDIRFIRENVDLVNEALKRRKAQIDLDEFLELDEDRRAFIKKSEELKKERNAASQEIGRLKREKKDASHLMEQMKDVGEKIKEHDIRLRDIEDRLQAIIMDMPNIPHSDVPTGDSDEDNEEVRRWGEPREFGFEAKPHWDLGAKLGILDPEAAARVTGARFTFLKGKAARLERALINFMLDLHTEEHGYMEIFPPFMAHRRSMTGTGQLPKFEEDAFKIESTEYFLIPTAEVPVTNMHREQILNAKELPLKYVAYSACFRAEAGSAGRDTRGLIRQHQFNKVELVKFANPDDSYEELERLTKDAEEVLKRLGLPYRVVTLCTGDLGFSSAKTYDIEVWMPSYNRYVEISSCSNFESFQARRADIRYRPKDEKRTAHVHTLNGSGVAIGRALAAIMENYQEEDGSIRIPDALIPYMGGVEKIET